MTARDPAGEINHARKIAKTKEVAKRGRKNGEVEERRPGERGALSVIGVIDPLSRARYGGYGKDARVEGRPANEGGTIEGGGVRPEDGHVPRDSRSS